MQKVIVFNGNFFCAGILFQVRAKRLANGVAWFFFRMMHKLRLEFGVFFGIKIGV
jgi:hypothetical protein